MRINLVLQQIGKLLIIVGLSMLFPLAWSIYYGDGDAWAFIISMVITLIAGMCLYLFCKPNLEDGFRQREGYMFVTCGWIIATVFGALPYLFAGVFTSFPDAFFETMSGFTTTGSSVLTMVEGVPRGILLWRSLTQWLGGVGIVVLFIAIIGGFTSSSGTSAGGSMFKAEHSGGALSEKITPRIGDTAKALLNVYLGLSFLMIVLLMFGGMNLYDSLVHTFATISTGGFSSKNASVGFYDSAYIQWVITIFMFLSGANLAYYYLMVKKRRPVFFSSDEFKTYLFLVLVAVAGISINLFSNDFFADKSIEYTIRQAAFQVVSVVTTTGFATCNYDLWPHFSKILLLILMFAGGCVGSTTGSVKINRWLIILKNTKTELSLLSHPKAVRSIRVNKKIISPSMVSNVLQFFSIYMMLFFAGALAMSALGLDFVESISASACNLSNVGPGFGSVGPAGNFAHIPSIGKWILSLLMLLGRLELYTVLTLFFPAVWKK